MSPALRTPRRAISRSSPRILFKKLAASGANFTGLHQDIKEKKIIPAHLTRSQSHPANCRAQGGCHRSAERFPVSSPYAVSSSIKSAYTSTKSCQWSGCDTKLDIGPRGLLSHIHEVHVLPQLSSKKGQFACLWSGCKVYGQSSVSSNWLSRHVQQHSEAKGKPFPCIFGGCHKRFSSSTLLQRHIDRDHVPHDFGNNSMTESGHFSSSWNFRSSISGLACKNPVSVKSCIRRTTKRRRRIRHYRVRHTDFYDLRSKAIIKNRLVLDKLLAESAIENLIAHPLSPTSDALVTGTVTLPLPIKEHSKVKFSNKRILRSNDAVSISTANKPESYRVKLLLTVPHTFVGQRLTVDNKTEYLVKWQGVLCADALPVMWVFEEEIQAAAALDKL